MRAKRLEMAPNPAETGCLDAEIRFNRRKRTVTSAAKLRAFGISAAC